MKKKTFAFIVCMTAVLAAAFGIFSVAAADGQVQAGVAAAVKGEVKATTPPETKPHVLKSGDKVFMGDKIETGDDGQLQVLLLDETVFTLGPKSAVTVDEFIYDPSTNDGKVKASMMKGIFRVVSGKVAHKKPENMNLDLPAGAIGFRGTNVAGIIDGAKTTVVLLGPVGVGRIYVTNVVNGEVVGVDIDEAGMATIVDGPDSPPVPVFQVSEADLNKIAAALGQEAGGASATTEGGDAGVTGGTGTPSGPAVDTQQLLDILNTVDTLNQQTQQAAQDHIDTSASSSNTDSHSSSNQHITSP